MVRSLRVPAPAAALLYAVVGAAAASMPAMAAEQPECSAPTEIVRFDHRLSHFLLRIAQRRPVKIVAIGSSSTSGAGASSWAATYPSRLEAELKERLPGLPVTVINKGIGGEEAHQMIARFGADVIDEKPDLVLWQVGSNSVLRDHPTPGQLIQDGVEKLKSTGAEVVLINPQFAPKILAKPYAGHAVDVITATARDNEVGLFDRFAVMRHWRDKGIPFEAFLSPDGLHLNDWSYACVAKLLATAILDGMKAPAGPATATATPPRAKP